MNTAVTVFKRVKNTGLQCFEWEKKVYRARVVSCEKICAPTGSDAMHKGRTVIRIFGECPIVNTGDMIVAGEAEGSSPPVSAGVVVSVKSNSRGSGFIRHTKIIAEG